MSRAQDLLDEAISLTEAAARNLADGELAARAGKLAAGMASQREKFFFKSLAGVPLANRARKAAQALSDVGTDDALGALESIVAEIDEKSDAPGTVLT